MNGVYTVHISKHHTKSCKTLNYKCMFCNFWCDACLYVQYMYSILLQLPLSSRTAFIILVLCWEDTNYTETTPNTARRYAVLLTNVLINLATSKLSKIF